MARWQLGIEPRAAADMPKLKIPFRLWYNDDTTNILSVDSPFRKRGESFSKKALIGSIDEVADKGVDAYALSPGLGHIPFWKSDVHPDHYAWWTAKTGLEPDAHGRYLLDGNDSGRDERAGNAHGVGEPRWFDTDERLA